MSRFHKARTVASLGADETLGVAGVELHRGGELSIQCLIDNGTDGVNPSDSPVGAWQLWSTMDGTNYTRLTSTAIDAELAKIAPNTNTAVNAVATFAGVAGTSCKVIYKRTSGGAATRARLFCVVG